MLLVLITIRYLRSNSVSSLSGILTGHKTGLGTSLSKSSKTVNPTHFLWVLESRTSQVVPCEDRKKPSSTNDKTESSRDAIGEEVHICFHRTVVPGCQAGCTALVRGRYYRARYRGNYRAGGFSPLTWAGGGAVASRLYR